MHRHQRNSNRHSPCSRIGQLQFRRRRTGRMRRRRFSSVSRSRCSLRRFHSSSLACNYRLRIGRSSRLPPNSDKRLQRRRRQFRSSSLAYNRRRRTGRLSRLPPNSDKRLRQFRSSSLAYNRRRRTGRSSLLPFNSDKRRHRSRIDLLQFPSSSRVYNRRHRIGRLSRLRCNSVKRLQRSRIDLLQFRSSSLASSRHKTGLMRLRLNSDRPLLSPVGRLNHLVSNRALNRSRDRLIRLRKRNVTRLHRSAIVTWRPQRGRSLRRHSRSGRRHLHLRSVGNRHPRRPTKRKRKSVRRSKW